MITLFNTSGLPNIPEAGKSAIYVRIDEYIGVRHSDGSTGSSRPAALSGLYDVAGIYTSGYSPRFDGTVFLPALIASGGVSPVYTNNSGFAQTSQVLASGFILNGGTAATIIFSGFDMSFDWLEVIGSTRSNANTTAIQVACYFNNDTTATNYIASRVQSNATNTLVRNASDDANIGTSQALQALQTNMGIVNNLHFMVPDYALSGHRKWAYITGHLPDNFEGATLSQDSFGIQWENTTGPPINMIELRGINATTTFTSGTSLFLIGHKKTAINLSGSYDNIRIINGMIVP